MRTHLALISLAALAADLVLACAGPGASTRAMPTTAETVQRAPSKLPFIEDDYARALAEARSAHKPLFIDAWATWCHTCMSMRAFVFTDPALIARANDFVWLSIDTEKPENARFMETHPMRNWPTLWIVDAATEKVALKWANSATATELTSLLDDAAAAMKQGDTQADAGAALVRGNQASAEGRIEEAVAEYRAALASAPPDWKKRANVVEALVLRLHDKNDASACAEVAASEVPRIAGGTSRATAATIGLECAADAEHENAQARAKLMTLIDAMAGDPREPIMADDRSQLYEALVSELHDEKREDEARAAAKRWAAFLEGEAARAATPAARAVFDPHRLSAYLMLGEPARAIPMLDASERDFPADYNPPARLARTYFTMKRYADALSAIDRALTRGYGPRKLRLWALKADILEATGDRRGAAAALRTALAESKGISLPGTGYIKLVYDLEERARVLEGSR